MESNYQNSIYVLKKLTYLTYTVIFWIFQITACFNLVFYLFDTFVLYHIFEGSWVIEVSWVIEFVCSKLGIRTHKV